MSNFVKIGKHRINLDKVSDVLELGDGSVRVYYDFAVSGEYNPLVIMHDAFKGDEAALLLAIIDQDDEAVDEIYQRVYDQSKPKESVHPAIQIVAETPTGHAIFMTNDFGL